MSIKNRGPGLNGTIHIVEDHQRTPLGEVLKMTLTEDDGRTKSSLG